MSAEYEIGTWSKNGFTVTLEGGYHTKGSGQEAIFITVRHDESCESCGEEINYSHAHDNEAGFRAQAFGTEWFTAESCVLADIETFRLSVDLMYEHDYHDLACENPSDFPGMDWSNLLYKTFGLELGLIAQNVLRHIADSELPILHLDDDEEETRKRYFMEYDYLDYEVHLIDEKIEGWREHYQGEVFSKVLDKIREGQLKLLKQRHEEKDFGMWQAELRLLEAELEELEELMDAHARLEWLLQRDDSLGLLKPADDAAEQT
jgi:hypothetical protein